MGAQLRVYRRRVRTVQSTKKITKAMELIATSRIAKAQARMKAARPYVEELTRALAALGRNATLRHPMLTGVESPRRAGIVMITSDRGLAGGYSANIIKRANELAARLQSEGKEPIRYVIGRKGVGYYRFRNIPITASWTGFSEQPTFVDAREATETVVRALQATSEGNTGSDENPRPGIDELYVVYTRFDSMITQVPTVAQVAPVASADNPGGDLDPNAEADESDESQALYEFEPEAELLIDALLPRYISARLFSALLEAAASESAARRRAMKSASDNADDLIRTYTRLANQARQAEITQEISEIVGGADALAAAGSEEQ
jgi:F-type H+-transporting ATPase subunit gamma